MCGVATSQPLRLSWLPHLFKAVCREALGTRTKTWEPREGFLDGNGGEQVAMMVEEPAVTCKLRMREWECCGEVL